MTYATDASGVQLERDMRALEADLQAMQNPWAEAERNLIETTARVERLKAPQRLRWRRQPPPGFGKPTKDDLDALLNDWMWGEHETLMQEQLNAEALCAAYGTKYRVATKALSSKQTRLNAEIRLHGSGR